MRTNSERDIALWHALFDSEVIFIRARMYFLSDSTDRVAVIREVLQNPLYRGTALRIFSYLTVEERQRLFDILLSLASVSHSDIVLCREIILSLPKDWVLANIEKSAEPLLLSGTYEEYRRLLELFIQLDRDLTYRLATRALQNTDVDIREAGEDFIERLKNS